MNKKISRRQLLALLAAATGGATLAWVRQLLQIPPAEAQTVVTLTPQSYLPYVARDGAVPTPASSPTPTATDTHTPTSTSSPTATSTSSPTPTATETHTPTSTSSPTATSTSGPTPTATETPTPTSTLPPGTGPKVVHAHDPDATSWDFSTGWYGDYVDQAVVNNMVDEGLKQLTGQSTVMAAWQTLLPGYSSGKAIAIKVNFNNCGGCGDSDNVIDALIEPVNALVRGMTEEMGVQSDDIWIYDAKRPLPDRFRNRCPYSGVHFVGTGGCSEQPTFNSGDPNARVNFGHPSLTARRIADVIINATYLINMPIVKDHGISLVTLGFKNHFGSIDQIIRPGEDNLHYYISPGDSRYSASYNPMLDIYLNPHIRDKTVLTVGDCLYGALGNTNVIPSRWASFGDDAPNSLFFGVDPVAIDCVMLDVLRADPAYHPGDGWPEVDDYLELAANAGLGVFERGDPWGSGYNHIDYLKLVL